MLGKSALIPVAIVFFIATMIYRLVIGPLEPNGPSLKVWGKGELKTTKFRFLSWCTKALNWIVNDDYSRSFCGHEYQKKKEGKRSAADFLDWVYSENHTMYAYIKYVTKDNK